MADAKISPHSLNDLKNTTDDALGNYLRGLNFQQDNSKLDVRLAAGYIAVIIAAATFAADYKLGWEATKGWTAVAVAAYAGLNGFFTYWMWGVERGIIFEGTREGKKISIASKTKKHDPTYYITVSTGGHSTWHIETPFTTWFTADGYFVAQPFQQWLASHVDMIGAADPKNSGSQEKSALSSPAGADEGDWMSNGTPGSSSGADPSKGKGSKRSKHKA